MTARDIVGLVQTLVLLAIALGTVLWSLYRKTDGRTAEDASADGLITVTWDDLTVTRGAP